MSVELRGETIHLRGGCGVEDSEKLLDHLLAGRTRVDLAACESMHAAVLQLLMAAQPAIVGPLPASLAHLSATIGDSGR
jgi:hypothetical protein